MSRRDYPVVPPGIGTLLLPPLVGLACLALLIGVFVAGDAKMEDWIRALPVFPCVLLLCLLTWNMAHRRVSVGELGLQVHGFPWSRPIAASSFDLDRAQVIDLARDKSLAPVFKLFGSRLPGYRAGHFRLRNGKRASLVITDTRRVLVLPRTDGNFVMLSVEQPQALLDALRRQTSTRG